MTWNYRLIKKHTKNPQSLGGNEYYTYAIHEAFYDSKGKVAGITMDPIDLSCEHLNDLMISWHMMSEAFGQPILDYETIGDDSEGLPGCSDEDIEEAVPLEVIEKEFELEPFDSDAYAREEAEQNEKEELKHTAEFVGRSPDTIRSLIEALRLQSP